jgi:hypothetical protein
MTAGPYFHTYKNPDGTFDYLTKTATSGLISGTITDPTVLLDEFVDWLGLTPEQLTAWLV